MARTRRRARVNDTGTHRNQRSVFDSMSVVEESVDMVTAEAVEVAESADEGFPHPDSLVHRSAEGFCRNCCNKLGEFYNSWHRVTGSYYVPALLGSYRSLLKSTGKEKAASKGTKFEEW